MSYNLIYTPLFSFQVKRLSKKFKSLKVDLKTFEKEIQQNPNIGVDLGSGLHKVRVAIKSKGKGKSGGARIITFLKLSHDEIYLLTIYDKSEIENIDIEFLKKLIKELK